MKKYNEFLVYKLFESILEADPKFIDVLKELSTQSNVAEELLKLIGQDLKLNHNFLKMSDDKDDDISFLPDGQAQRTLSSGKIL